MTLNSKYFDSIRSSSTPRGGKKKKAAPDKAPTCEWKGCDKPGAHRAPKGRGAARGAATGNDYFQFCIDHVRQYNANYNYFDGMSDDAVATFQKENLTGNRPTWKMTGKPAGPPPDRYSIAEEARAARQSGSSDPLGIFAKRRDRRTYKADPERRGVRRLEMKALKTLGLDVKSTPAEVKAQFKKLAKLYHPDGNGGDRGAEEKLREVIQAYNYLKQAGHV